MSLMKILQGNNDKQSRTYKLSSMPLQGSLGTPMMKVQFCPSDHGTNVQCCYY
jgi:hypothetical protein